MPHVDEVWIFVSEKKPNILGIIQTKIDNAIENSDIEIDDYVLERNDNDKNKHGGGAALYVRKYINYKLEMSYL